MTNKKNLIQDEKEKILQEDATKELEDTSQLDKLKVQIEKIEKERDDYLKGWQQERADILNYKQKESERMTGAIKFANQSLLKNLISVLDDFNFTVSNLESLQDTDKEMSKNWEVMLKGIYLIQNNLEHTLAEYGLVKIESLGKIFNPVLHEAINYISDPSKPADIITEELQNGYTLEGRTIRPAKVVVNSPPEVKVSKEFGS
jgi:molecular chaperone GrpE